MRHARADYERIQDPAGLIPEDEPVFLIRGQDLVGPVAVMRWADLAEEVGAEPKIVAAAREQAQKMIKWHALCSSKIPDLPEES